MGGISIPPARSSAKLTEKVLLFYLLLIILVLVLVNAQSNGHDDRENEKLDNPDMDRRDGIAVVQKHRKQHNENVIAHK